MAIQHRSTNSNRNPGERGTTTLARCWSRRPEGGGARVVEHDWRRRSTSLSAPGSPVASTQRSGRWWCRIVGGRPDLEEASARESGGFLPVGWIWITGDGQWWAREGARVNGDGWARLRSCLISHGQTGTYYSAVAGGVILRMILFSYSAFGSRSDQRESIVWF
jgi:hypothetical protein